MIVVGVHVEVGGRRAETGEQNRIAFSFVPLLVPRGQP